MTWLCNFTFFFCHLLHCLHQFSFERLCQPVLVYLFLYLLCFFFKVLLLVFDLCLLVLEHFLGWPLNHWIHHLFTDMGILEWLLLLFITCFQMIIVRFIKLCVKPSNCWTHIVQVGVIHAYGYAPLPLVFRFSSLRNRSSSNVLEWSRHRVDFIGIKFIQEF